MISMSRTLLKLRYVRASFQVANVLIVSSSFLGLLGATTMLLQSHSANAQPSPAPSVTPSPNSPQRGDVQAQQTRLSGQWQAKNPASGQVLTLIFTPDGKFFVLLPSGSDTPVAQQLGYRIDPTPKPMHIDVTFPGTTESVKTIFEFTADGQLRLQVAETNPGEPRPTAFNPSATLFQKVSDAITLPPNVQVSDLQTGVNRAQQAEGKTYIGAMNRAQQAYHLENDKFATKIEDLGIGIKPETETYRYRIVSQGNSTQSVMMTAQAKRPELRSYTGAVFVVKHKNETLTVAAICETDQPSSTPPAMPTAPKTAASSEIQCPAGSNRLGR